jgi:hypothetical protein
MLDDFEIRDMWTGSNIEDFSCLLEAKEEETDYLNDLVRFEFPAEMLQKRKYS